MPMFTDLVRNTFRHEVFTDYVLDALKQGDAISKFAVVAAYKCKGVPQDMIDIVKDRYFGSLQQNYDNIIEGKDGMKKVLDDR